MNKGLGEHSRDRHPRIVVLAHFIRVDARPLHVLRPARVRPMLAALVRLLACRARVAVTEGMLQIVQLVTVREEALFHRAEDQSMSGVCLGVGVEQFRVKHLARYDREGRGGERGGGGGWGDTVLGNGIEESRIL